MNKNKYGKKLIMKNVGGKNTKSDVEPKFKHFALAMLIILSVISPFFIIGGNKAKKWKEYLQTNGTETIAFYAYPAGRMSNRTYNFQYKINGERYTARLNKPFELPRMYPFKEVPILIRYVEKEPNKNIVLPDKTFHYKGYEFKWITHEKSRYYYVQIKKIE